MIDPLCVAGLPFRRAFPAASTRDQATRRDVEAGLMMRKGQEPGVIADVGRTGANIVVAAHLAMIAAGSGSRRQV